eukprot:TRINITY_DN568_c0_g1_i1.p2 TRINITY_DN568_c0_g1~~TRINITY_DN568_c0_g1_i1.p2  ORF type:complete len:151 (-),score=16.06 TRINITY_DN568_c0_g1_i1:183-635(-)
MLRRGTRELPSLYKSMLGSLQSQVRNMGGGGGGDDKYKFHRHPLEPPREDELERMKLMNNYPFYFGNPYPRIPKEELWQYYPIKYPTVMELCMWSFCVWVVYYTVKELYTYGLFGIPPENPYTRFVYDGEPYYNRHTHGKPGEEGEGGGH